MLLPEEILVKKVLPKLKFLLTIRLYEKGFTQGKLSKILGISQPLVNNYLKLRIRGEYETFEELEKIGIKKKDIEELVNYIVEEKVSDSITLIRILENFWKNMISSGAICAYHIKVAHLDPRCDVCLIKKFQPQNKKDMIEEIKNALKILEKSSEFHHIVPEINTNIAYALPNARFKFEVLSFPGRLIKFKKRIKAIAEPEFGASTHLANMLILAHSRNKEIRACMYIKYNKKVQKVLDKIGLDYKFNFILDSEDDPVLFSFKKFLEENDVPRILIDKDRKGFEPVCYIFGKDPIDVVTLAVDIANEYSNLFL
jgi:Uncharacterized conserved protein